MKRKSNLLLAAAAWVALAAAGLATDATAQTAPKPLKQQLVGHWRLVSVTVNETKPYGDDPSGSLFLDAGGHYSLIVVTAGRATNIAYFGTYTVDDAEQSVTMHVDSTGPGTPSHPDQKRFVKFEGDELMMQNQNLAGAIGGVKLTWKQAN